MRIELSSLCKRWTTIKIYFKVSNSYFPILVCVIGIVTQNDSLKFKTDHHDYRDRDPKKDI